MMISLRRERFQTRDNFWRILVVKKIQYERALREFAAALQHRAQHAKQERATTLDWTGNCERGGCANLFNQNQELY